jgi:hypothetical protein
MRLRFINAIHPRDLNVSAASQLTPQSPGNLGKFHRVTLHLARRVKAGRVPYVAESLRNDYERAGTEEEIMRKGLVVLGLVFSGCSFGSRAQPPLPAPALPEVAYVAACDPKAVAGLTQDAVDALRERDQVLRRHIQHLEQQIRSGQ